jgi:hypothetical protein
LRRVIFDHRHKGKSRALPAYRLHAMSGGPA